MSKDAPDKSDGPPIRGRRNPAAGGREIEARAWRDPRPEDSPLATAMDTFEEVALNGAPDSSRYGAAKGLIEAASAAREIALVRYLRPPALAGLNLPSYGAGGDR